MAAGGCGLFLVNLNHGSIENLFAGMFGLGVLMFVVGLIVLVVQAILDMRRKVARQR